MRVVLDDQQERITRLNIETVVWDLLNGWASGGGERLSWLDARSGDGRPNGAG
jgi:hypothetical protein